MCSWAHGHRLRPVTWPQVPGRSLRIGEFLGLQVPSQDCPERVPLLSHGNREERQLTWLSVSEHKTLTLNSGAFVEVCCHCICRDFSLSKAVGTEHKTPATRSFSGGFFVLRAAVASAPTAALRTLSGVEGWPCASRGLRSVSVTHTALQGALWAEAREVPGAAPPRRG